jgi:hypothetical protein
MCLSNNPTGGAVLTDDGAETVTGSVVGWWAIGRDV